MAKQSDPMANKKTGFTLDYYFFHLPLLCLQIRTAELTVEKTLWRIKFASSIRAFLLDHALKYWELMAALPLTPNVDDREIPSIR